MIVKQTANVIVCVGSFLDILSHGYVVGETNDSVGGFLGVERAEVTACSRSIPSEGDSRHMIDHIPLDICNLRGSVRTDPLIICALGTITLAIVEIYIIAIFAICRDCLVSPCIIFARSDSILIRCIHFLSITIYNISIESAEILTAIKSICRCGDC